VKFCHHLPAQRMIWDNFLKIVKAPGGETFSAFKFPLKLSGPRRVFRLHQVEPGGSILRDACIYKHIGIDGVREGLSNCREQRPCPAVRHQDEI
jgi:hypothetical protein